MRFLAAIFSLVAAANVDKVEHVPARVRIKPLLDAAAMPMPASHHHSEEVDELLLNATDTI